MGEASSTSSPPAVQRAAIRYAIDSVASRFTVRAFATGMLSAFGHNPTIAMRDFSGEVWFDPGHPEGARLNLRIPAASLSVANDISSKDRREMERQMRDDVLETDRFPEIVYDCSQASVTAAGENQYGVSLNGELTLHGVTRREPVSARVIISGDLLRAFGEFSIRQTDYNIKLVTALGGTLKLQDELKFSFDITARKHDQ